MSLYSTLGSLQSTTNVPAKQTSLCKITMNNLWSQGYFHQVHSQFSTQSQSQLYQFI